MKRFAIWYLILYLLCGSAFATTSTDTCFGTDAKLMAHMDGTDGSTTFTDSSASAHTLTVAGNSQIDTAQSKFGGASGLFDGNGDKLTTDNAATSSDWTLGTGDFTIDFWVRFNSTPTSIDFLGQGPENTKWEIRRDGAGKFGIELSGTFIVQFSWTPSTATWYHVAFVRSSGTTKIYIDGSSQSSGTDNSNYSSNAAVVVSYLGNAYLDGWIDELRIVNGTGVWTSNFTAPSAAYSACVAPRTRNRLRVSTSD